ncbi:MAG: hypothetical protein GWM90_12685, partial [Gemmatimonadetes bacterium]|nr:hypothetical protein [Gemmatimonadota bacterium]NIQ54912.1 hypothetical protein [Gemmatimonadota bacterium]NIU75109.1 hypothetical protein [Gammaproteobacteria bacterium]NIX44940.1 hypothetical protein [Gemmatimonadota bacterium]NIY09173.1 hypothetical protein [Gemmatimonadota bacterium]
IGDWRVDQRIRVGPASFERYAARSRVRVAADGAAVVESWEGRVRFVWAGMAEPVPIRGASVRVHDPATGAWRIFWIDTLEPRFESPFEGRFTTGPPVVGAFERTTAEGGRLRIRFRPRPDGAILWDLAALESGEDPRTLWTMTFTRARVGTGRRVLFIGNSLTLQNDLPRMVEVVAAEAGATVDAHAVAGPGMSLEDHWNSGVPSVVGRRGWDAVVLQQGPSTLPDSRAHLRLWAGRLADTIRAVGAVPYLYMVWPPRDGDWDRGAGSYRQAAEAARAGLLPVAEAFRAAWRRDPSLRLLGSDGFHPTPLGTYLAAVVILAGLEGTRPVAMPGGMPGILPVDPAVAATLREAAAEAIAAAGLDPG